MLTEASVGVHLGGIGVISLSGRANGTRFVRYGVILSRGVPGGRAGGEASFGGRRSGRRRRFACLSLRKTVSKGSRSQWEGINVLKGYEGRQLDGQRLAYLAPFAAATWSFAPFGTAGARCCSGGGGGGLAIRRS